MSGKRVFITGCDSGFGQLMALHYSKQGAHVFAGVLTTENGKSLESRCKGKYNITAVVLDVTAPQQFQEAYSRVAATLDGSSLDAVICNAGIYKGWMVEFTKEEEYHQVMNVNFMGCLRTIQTFLPLMRKPGGRVIGITSCAALLAGHGMSSYACSKFAQGALLDTLRIELRSTGISVIQICPGFFNTAILTSHQKEITFKERYQRASEDVRGRYGAVDEDSMKMMRNTEKMAQNPMKVVSAVKGAMLNRWPAARMLVGLDAQLIGFLTFLPACILDPILSVLFT